MGFIPESIIEKKEKFIAYMEQHRDFIFTIGAKVMAVVCFLIAFVYILKIINVF